MNKIKEKELEKQMKQAIFIYQAGLGSTLEWCRVGYLYCWKIYEQFRNRLTKEFGERRRMTSTLWKQVIRRYPACLKCGSTENLAVDHITPLFSFGKTEWGNLQTLCGRCNRQKGVTTADYRR